MKRESGAAIVEFALILPLMLILIFITTEFGRAYYYYNTLSKGVRQAARYLSVRILDPTKPNVYDPAKNIIVYGNTAGTGNPLIPGLSISNVPNPTYASTGTLPVINTVTISVTGYTFTPRVPSVWGFRFSNITFGPIRATMRSPT